MTQAIRVNGVARSFQSRFRPPRNGGTALLNNSPGAGTAVRGGIAQARLIPLLAFLAVGLAMVLVNAAVFWSLTSGAAALPYLLAAALARQAAILSTFFLIHRLVLARPRELSAWQTLRGLWVRHTKALPIQLAVLYLLVEVFEMTPMLGNVVSVGLVCAVQYRADLLAGRQTGAAQVVRLPSTPPPAMLFVPAALTLLVTPGSARHLLEECAKGGHALAAVLVGVSCFGLLTVARSRPAPGEPDVHDRQLDIILALLCLATSSWLTLGWDSAWVPGSNWSVSAVLAVVTFAFAASFALLGTRATVRLRWALLMPLSMLPAFQQEAWTTTATAVVIVVFTASTLVRTHRRGRPPVVDAPSSHGMVGAVGVAPWRTATIAIASAALLLGGLTMARQAPTGASAGSPFAVGSNG